jgi:hypothetical protein
VKGGGGVAETNRHVERRNNIWLCKLQIERCETVFRYGSCQAERCGLSIHVD